MKHLYSEVRLCECCMTEHEVETVRVAEHAVFKKEAVDYEGTYFYCSITGELYADETQMRDNDIALKDAFRKAQGLFTSEEIIALRAKYGITQSDLCVLLGWGGKTITRYESHQVQDRAHDTIMKKLDQDPEWFLCLLEGAKGELSQEAYQKFGKIAIGLFEDNRDLYLRKSIEARYARYLKNLIYHGNTALSLEKAVDMIKYLAASDRVTELYKSKLMKLMWYSDALAYQKRNRAITGLVYQVTPIGILPLGHDAIVNLPGVPSREIEVGEVSTCYFKLHEKAASSFLTSEETAIIDMVIDKLGQMSGGELTQLRRREIAVCKAEPGEPVPFSHAASLLL